MRLRNYVEAVDLHRYAFRTPRETLDAHRSKRNGHGKYEPDVIEPTTKIRVGEAHPVSVRLQ